MTHPNEEMLRIAYNAFLSGDINTLMNSFTDDIVWHASGRSPVAGDYSGKDEVLSFFGKMLQLYGGTLTLKVLDILANDRHGIVLTLERAEHAGKVLEFRSIHEFEIQDGKCISFTSFNDDTYNEYWSSWATGTRAC